MIEVYRSVADAATYRPLLGVMRAGGSTEYSGGLGGRDAEARRSGYALVGTFGGDASVQAEPFEAAAIPPEFLWGRDRAAPQEPR